MMELWSFDDPWELRMSDINQISNVGYSIYFFLKKYQYGLSSSQYRKYRISINIEKKLWMKFDEIPYRSRFSIRSHFLRHTWIFFPWKISFKLMFGVKYCCILSINPYILLSQLKNYQTYWWLINNLHLLYV